MSKKTLLKNLVAQSLSLLRIVSVPSATTWQSTSACSSSSSFLIVSRDAGTGDLPLNVCQKRTRSERLQPDSSHRAATLRSMGEDLGMASSLKTGRFFTSIFPNFFGTYFEMGIVLGIYRSQPVVHRFGFGFSYV